MADARVAADVKDQARAVHAVLDPVALLCEMRTVQQQLVEIADQTSADDSKPTASTLQQFLSGLRTAWKEGEVRPTAPPDAKSYTPAPPAGSICGCRWSVARMVRSRAMADVARAACALANRTSWQLSGQAAAYAATPGEGVAADDGAKNGLRCRCDRAIDRQCCDGDEDMTRGARRRTDLTMRDRSNRTASRSVILVDRRPQSLAFGVPYGWGLTPSPNQGPEQ